MKRKTSLFNNRKLVRLGISILLPSLLLLIPPSIFGIPGLTQVQHRVIALFVLSATFWILEPIPIYATSILIIALELIWLSDAAFLPFRSQEGPEFGVLLDSRAIMGVFGSPILLLFLGGFFLARAATKYRLDVNLARVFLKPMGSQPEVIMLGLMGITAGLSMFMSNTATTAMVLSILLPILAQMPESDTGKTGLALSVPLAANVGGLGTPIGTPPNAIVLEYLPEGTTLDFSSWMAFGVPLVLILLVIGWYLLRQLYPFQTDNLQLDLSGRFLRSPKAWIVYGTFCVTILLWLTDFLHGMNTYVVAIIPLAVFLATDVLNKEDLKMLSWDVLWLVAGGIALGIALEASGLAENLVKAIPFASFPVIVVLIALCVVAVIMANFMSNTATANLLLPLVAALGVSLSGLEIIGGETALLVGVALACSLGMALPISTPPNALAYATGEIESAQMTRVGIIMGVIGLLLVFLLLYILKRTHFLG